MTPTRFRNLVLAHYKKHGRHDLPWRKTKNPYRILVSEVMLQQTQVERVIAFYTAFLNEFPDVRAHASAPLSRVLIRWQGL
ncbi:MAG: A/G-specific adenine glycosylase, partial [bacterium]|nr:A/G-specific adenine glycosylase [bacterium]